MRYPQLSLTALAALCAALLAGCSSQPDRTEIFVGTTPPGASCVLTRLGQPIATLASTPAIALVEPGASDITILLPPAGFCRCGGDAARPGNRLELRRDRLRPSVFGLPAPDRYRLRAATARAGAPVTGTREKAPSARRAPCALPQSSAPAMARSAESSRPLVSGLSDRAITTLTAAVVARLDPHRERRRHARRSC